MKLLILIPIFNEEAAIGKIVSDLRKLSYDVVVVDDGSTDKGADIAQRSGAILLRNEQNSGKGYSLKKGFEYAALNGFDSLVVMDGDGQHSIKDIPNFLTDDFAGFDLIIGNRMANPKGMPFVRLVTNKLMSWLISRITHQRVRDSQCGFRLLRKNAFSKIDLKCKRFEVESEMILRASRLGLKIANAPVETVYAGEVSKINPIKDTIRFFSFFINFLKEK